MAIAQLAGRETVVQRAESCQLVHMGQDRYRRRQLEGPRVTSTARRFSSSVLLASHEQVGTAGERHNAEQLEDEHRSGYRSSKRHLPLPSDCEAMKVPTAARR
jgi:hypothetical protein